MPEDTKKVTANRQQNCLSRKPVHGPLEFWLAIVFSKLVIVIEFLLLFKISEYYNMYTKMHKMFVRKCEHLTMVAF